MTGVGKLVLTIHILFLKYSKFKRIKDLLPKEHITEIKVLQKVTPETKNLFNHINGMPDMSEEEAEVQIINLDKSMIEHGLGFLEWEKQELRLIEKYNQESKNKVLKRINLLREWAIENDMIKSKLVRLKEHSLLRVMKTHNKKNKPTPKNGAAYFGVRRKERSSKCFVNRCGLQTIRSVLQCPGLLRVKMQ